MYHELTKTIKIAGTVIDQNIFFLGVNHNIKFLKVGPFRFSVIFNYFQTYVQMLFLNCESLLLYGEPCTMHYLTGVNKNFKLI